MVKKFIQLKHFTRSSSRGFTLLELLVTLVVASVITGLALKLIVDQRQLFLNDQIRTQVNQNSRAALDLVGTDIKLVGERIPKDSPFPVVKIKNGASNTPDELVLQSLVINETLPVCQTLTQNTTQSTIEVSSKAIPTGICSFSDGNTNNLPDNLEQWQSERCNTDGISGCNRTPPNIDRTNPSDRCIEEKDGTKMECLWAYIYDPDTKQGEFFLYGFEDPKDKPDTPTNTYRVHRVDGGKWKYTYPYDALSATNPTNPTLYILEERTYSLVPNGDAGDKVLQLTLNGQTSPDFLVNKQTSPIRLVNQLSDFQVQALMRKSFTPLTREDFNNTAIDDWKQIKAIEIKVTARNTAPNSTKVSNLTSSAQFFPRNVTSIYK